MTHYKHRFDFDVGYLVKSPCRDCENRPAFPDCWEQCEILDGIRETLRGAVSSTRGFSSLESFSIFLESGERK